LLATLSTSTPLHRRRPDSRAVAPPLKSIGDRRLLRRLGAGGMSDVYLAYDPERHTHVAVKVLPDDLARNITYVDRFRREAEIGRLIDHPNIVHCYESGQDSESGRRYLVLEYIKGHSAQSRLDKGGPMPLADATRVTLDIARALEELHYRGYVHRDVKPGNILISDDGKAKLADLGVAKLMVDATELTALDQGIGTPYYMPWEQTLNASLVDPRSDLFALGATYYHLITGRVPFPGKDVVEVARLKDLGAFTPARAIDESLPRSVDTILAKLLARMPADRFQNAAQLIDVLGASGLANDRAVASPLADTDLPPGITRPDMKVPKKGAAKPAGPAWTYQYQTETGWKKGKARALDIVQWFEDGFLPDEFFLARPGQKTCRHFRTFPEFKDLRRRPKPEPKPTKRRFGLFGLGLGVAVLVTASASTVLHLLAAN
jgi:eukaryotic-like serine/threonine-protein kinase